MTPTDQITAHLTDLLAAAEAELGRPLDADEAESVIDEALNGLNEDEPVNYAATPKLAIYAYPDESATPIAYAAEWQDFSEWADGQDDLPSLREFVNVGHSDKSGDAEMVAQLRDEVETAIERLDGGQRDIAQTLLGSLGDGVQGIIVSEMDAPKQYQADSGQLVRYAHDDNLPIKQTNMGDTLAGAGRFLGDILTALTHQPDIKIDVHVPEIKMPEIRIPKMDAPQVTVNPTIKVDVPKIDVPAANVTVNVPSGRRKLILDKDGNPIGSQPE